MRQDVFEIDQALQVQTQLRIAPGNRLAQSAAAKAEVTALDLLAFALGRDMAVDQFQQAPRLRRQFIETATEHVMGNAVGESNVIERDFDVLNELRIVVICALVGFEGALMLMQESDDINQRQVLLVIAAQARGLVGEGEVVRIGIQHVERPQQALRVLVQGNQRLLVALGLQAGQRPSVALQLMNGARLFPSFIDGQQQAAIQEFFVEVARRCRQQQGHRAFNAILLGDQVARVRVFAGAGDGQLTLGLQQLQGVTRSRRAFFFDDGQRLVFQVGLAHVEQALPGHGAVFHFVFLGDEGEYGVHQGGLAGRR